MAITKQMIITITDSEVNIDREGLDINDAIIALSAVLFDVASHLEGVSTADVAFDAVNIAIGLEQNLKEESKNVEEPTDDRDRVQEG